MKYITLIENVFCPESSKIQKSGDFVTLLDAYNGTGSSVPFGDYGYIINGERICDPEYILHDDDIINGIATPTGGGDTQTAGGLSKVGGWLAIAGGIFAGGMLGGTVGAILSASLIGSGVSMVLGGSYLLWGQDVMDFKSNPSSKTAPSMRGGNNILNIGGAMPLILGRHKIAPFYAGEYFDLIPDTTENEIYVGKNSVTETLNGPYMSTYTQTTVTDVYYAGNDLSKKQDFYALFCTGQKSLNIETNTYKLGDTALTSYSDYETEEIQDGSISSLIPYSYNSVANPMEIKWNDDITAEDGAILITAPSGIDYIESDILFPHGLIKYDDDGDERANDTAFSVYFKPTDSSTWSRYRGKKITLKLTERDGFRYRIRITGLNKNKQYELKYVREKKQSSKSSKYIDQMYAGSVRGRRPVGDVIPQEYREALSFIALKIRSTDQLAGVVDNFNLIAQTKIRDYDGSGTGSSNWPVSETSNPASIALYLITSSEVLKAKFSDDSEIDWPSFEAWHTFCNTKNYECNMTVTENIQLSELLEIVGNCGRAQICKKEGKYSVIIDMEQVAPVQLFNQRNSRNFKTVKSYPEIPDAIKCNFIDASVGFQQAQAIIERDETEFPTILNPSYQTTDILGVTNYNQMWSLLRYKIACSMLRSEIHTFETDIEHIRCTRGDWIRVANPVPSWGIGSGGRIIAVTESAGNVVSIETDEFFITEIGKTYGVSYRKSNGTIVQKELALIIATEATNLFTFKTPFSTEKPEQGDLVSFGIYEYVTNDLLVQEITWSGDAGAVLTCIEYAPDVFTADSGTIPAFDPRISLSGDTPAGGYLGNFVIEPKNDNENNSLISQYFAQTSVSLQAKYPDIFRATNNHAMYFSEFGLYNYYTNLTDGKLYQREINRVSDGHAITTDSAGTHCHDSAGNIFYSNMSHDSYLYRKNTDDLTNGTAINSVYSWCPVYDSANEQLFYINRSDNDLIYCKNIGDSLNGNAISTAPAGWIQYDTANDLIYYTNMDNGGEIWVKSGSDTGNGSVVVAFSSVCFALSENNTNILYINETDLTVYEKLIGSDPAVSGDDVYLLAIHIDVSPLTGNVYMTSAWDNGTLYLGLKNRAVESPSLSASEYGYNIIGDITNGSRVVSNVSFENTDVIEVNDAIYGTGIPAGAFVTSKSRNFFLLSVPATTTGTGESFEIRGSRIFLNANRVVVPGTIEARLLSASAINSKTHTDAGNHITDFGLDNGTIKIRKQDDDLVLDFDPSRTGNELKITGTVQSGNYEHGVAGWKIDNSGDAELNNVEVRGQLTIGGGNTNGMGVGSTAIALNKTYTGTDTYADIYNDIITGNPTILRNMSYSVVGSCYISGEYGNILYAKIQNPTGVTSSYFDTELSFLTLINGNTDLVSYSKTSEVPLGADSITISSLIDIRAYINIVPMNSGSSTIGVVSMPFSCGFFKTVHVPASFGYSSLDITEHALFENLFSKLNSSSAFYSSISGIIRCITDNKTYFVMQIQGESTDNILILGWEVGSTTNFGVMDMIRLDGEREFNWCFW